jgi:3-hydroxy-D-aspartate aldolase
MADRLSDSAIVGLTVPARVGMKLEDVATPALIVELDAFERNVAQMRTFITENDVRHRAHAKTHKSADIARFQIEHGGACGICCQKVSEAEALVAEGVGDVLISNEVVDVSKIDRLARLACDARVLVCVDDLANVNDLSAAALTHRVSVECLVEIDCGAGRCGAGRCGAEWGAPVVALARKITRADGLRFSGLQAYQGAAQHVREYAERKAKIDTVLEQVSATIDMLTTEGIACEIVSGAGTGTYYFEGASEVYNERSVVHTSSWTPTTNEFKTSTGCRSRNSKTVCSSTPQSCPRRRAISQSATLA